LFQEVAAEAAKATEQYFPLVFFGPESSGHLCQKITADEVVPVVL